MCHTIIALVRNCVSILSSNILQCLSWVLFDTNGSPVGQTPAEGDQIQPSQEWLPCSPLQRMPLTSLIPCMHYSACEIHSMCVQWCMHNYTVSSIILLWDVDLQLRVLSSTYTVIWGSHRLAFITKLQLSDQYTGSDTISGQSVSPSNPLYVH